MKTRPKPHPTHKENVKKEVLKMTREEIKNTIANAVKNKLEKITITGNFGCGQETFDIKINHVHKVFYCKEYFPICVLNDIRANGYKDLGGVNI